MEPHHQGLWISEAAAPHPQQCSRGSLCLVGLLVGPTGQPPTFGPQRGTAGHREKAMRALGDSSRNTWRPQRRPSPGVLQASPCRLLFNNKERKTPPRQSHLGDPLWMKLKVNITNHRVDGVRLPAELAGKFLPNLQN